MSLIKLPIQKRSAKLLLPAPPASAPRAASPGPTARPPPSRPASHHREPRAPPGGQPELCPAPGRQDQPQLPRRSLRWQRDAAAAGRNRASRHGLPAAAVNCALTAARAAFFP